MSDTDPPRGPSRSNDGHDEPTSSPLTACRRCRKQKLRCSRDLPTCKRCRDISSPCEYPPPPDRKLLAAQRLQNAKARARRESEGSSSFQDQRKLSDDSLRGKEAIPMPSQYTPLTRSYSVDASDYGGFSVHEEHQFIAPTVQTKLKDVKMPSSALAIFLIDIYFTRVYNGGLLFHYETFISDFAASRVPDFIALAIFASASVFFRHGPGNSQQLVGADGEGVEIGRSMTSAADWTKQGDDWADAASQRAMMQADVQRLETVQACQCLGLYWWNTGERSRFHILSQIAYSNCRLMGLHLPSDDLDPFLDEGRRRLFWACWTNQCISQENTIFNVEPWNDAIGLKLPSEDRAWRARRPTPLEIFDDKGNIVNIAGSEKSAFRSSAGEMVKLVALWWAVHRFVQLPTDNTPDDAARSFADLLELDRRLVKFFDNFAALAAPNVTKYDHFALHCMYRGLVCTLHSSVVPLFSNKATNPNASKKAMRLSAEECVKHAAITLEMATTFMGSRPDLSRLTGVVGFAMFVALTIEFKSLVAQKKLQMLSMGRFKAAIFIHDRLRVYWGSLQSLWTKSKAMFADAGISIESISTDSRYELSPHDQYTDFDKIVSHEGTTQSGDDPTPFTYSNTHKSECSDLPRRSSDANSRTQSNQNTPSPGITKEQTLPIHQRSDAQINPNVQAYAPQHQYSSSHSPQSLNYGFEQQQRQSITASLPNFIPMGTVPEGSSYQAQNPASSISYRTKSSSEEAPALDGIVNIPEMMGPGLGTDTEMDIDGTNFWWDQSYGNFDMEVIDPNFNGSSETYQFQSSSVRPY